MIKQTSNHGHNNIYPLDLPIDLQYCISKYVLHEPKNVEEYYNLNYNIVNMDLSYIAHILTDEHMSILQHFKRLRYLSLRNCHKITDKGLSYLQLPHLQKISLGSCYGISDRGLLYLQSSPLQYISLCDCPDITDDGISYLQTFSLRYLDLSYNYNVTDKCLSYIHSMPLQYFAIVDNDKITYTGLLCLQSLSLRYLNVDCCENLSHDERYKILSMFNINGKPYFF